MVSYHGCRSPRLRLLGGMVGCLVAVLRTIPSSLEPLTVSVKGYSKKNDFGKKVQKFEKRLGGVQVAVAGLREEVQGGALVDKLRFRVVISIQLATLMVLIAMLLDVV